MITYRKARPEEFDQMAAFANLVFNHKGDTIQFDRDLTKVYGPNADRRFVADMHTLAVDDEKGIRALIGALPNTMHTPAGDLSIRYIGTVSVHPDARGEGHMKAILPAILREAKENNVDIAMLGGQRQRYGYFGFAPCGEVWTVTVIPANVRHALKGVDDDVIWTRVLPEDDAVIDAVCDLHEGLLIRFDRPKERFVELCASYGLALWAAKRHGGVIGYAVADRRLGSWTEVAASDNEALNQMVKAWLNQFGQSSLSITLPDWQTAPRLHLSTYAEEVTMSSGSCANILDPAHVIKVLLNTKTAYAKIQDGEATFKVNEEEPFKVTVKDGKATVAAGEEEKAIHLTGLEMSTLFSCPYPYEGRPDVPDGWFPLAVYAQATDTF